MGRIGREPRSFLLANRDQNTSNLFLIARHAIILTLHPTGQRLYQRIDPSALPAQPFGGIEPSPEVPFELAEGEVDIGLGAIFGEGFGEGFVLLEKRGEEREVGEVCGRGGGRGGGGVEA
jgi:hypothetical protein